jgi:hypothetical protein
LIKTEVNPPQEYDTAVDRGYPVDALPQEYVTAVDRRYPVDAFWLY